MAKRTYLALLLLFIASFCLDAQNRITLTGTVRDAQGQPVIGANVMMKGSTTGAATDLDGKYSLSVPDNAQVEYSCIGYTTVVEKVGGRKEINIVLKDDNTYLESVVIVGYGTQKKGSITGSISGVSGENMLHTKSENPQNMLTGRVAGVRVWQKSAEPGTYSNSFDVRGLGTPLVVIDDVPRSIEDLDRKSVV